MKLSLIPIIESWYERLGMRLVKLAEESLLFMNSLGLSICKAPTQRSVSPKPTLQCKSLSAAQDTGNNATVC